jgi:hypothetical protein
MASIVRIATAVLLGASLLCAPSLAADPETAALAMIAKLGLGNNLKILGFLAAAKTQTYRIMVQTVGPNRTDTLIREELENASPKYQDQWNKRLAGVYAPRFSAEELESIAEYGRQSPQIKKLSGMKQSEIAAIMEANSKDILVDYVTDALTNAFRKVVPTK